MAELNIREEVWKELGHVPEMPLDRDERSRIIYGVCDPLWDIDTLPLTYVNSRWYAFAYEAEEKDLRRCLPEPLALEDDVVEFWYVDHNNTNLGPYGEFGITVGASYTAPDGTKYLGGYYPYMYLTQDAAIDAGRVLGFPKKGAFIRVLEHGAEDGSWDAGYLLGCACMKAPLGKYFSFAMARYGYLIHTATGQFTGRSITDLERVPIFYGKTEWGRMNMKLVTDGDLRRTKWQLTYLASEWQGKHRFQLKPETVRTAKPEDINWFWQATPFDNMCNMLPVKRLLGLIAFSFDLIIPAPSVLWERVIERTDEDIQALLPQEMYSYGMRHRFIKPYGV